jgi:hypothetical protein
MQDWLDGHYENFHVDIPTRWSWCVRPHCNVSCLQLHVPVLSQSVYCT